MLVALREQLWFPEPDTAQEAPWNGLLAVGGDFSVERLLLAYRSGIFPWTSQPITWWSPDPRAIFELDRLHISRSLQRTLRRHSWVLTRDRAFRAVLEGCAAPGPGRESTWVTPEFIEAYVALHRAGFAHSVECWAGDALVGGIYGVSIGGLFAGESMFHRVSNASKVALHALWEHLRRRGFRLFDIQMLTPVTTQLGAITISRAEYLERLRLALPETCTF